MRVAYREGQRLRAADLTAEQEYLIAIERRHNLMQHSSGVVAGLGRGSSPAGIEPGVAVNAEGRLLIVDDVVPVADGKCVDAWLIHCETPGPPRRRGLPPCEPAQADRRQETARVVPVTATPNASIAAPTADAVYLGRSGCGNDVRKPEYTAAAAATVKDPAGRAVMYVGPSSAGDRSAFLISTIGHGGSLAPRIALDRLGDNRFIGTVTLADYHYCELLRLTNDKVLTLRAKAPGSPEQTLHLMITPSRVGNTRRLELQAYSGTKRVGTPLVWLESPDLDLDAEIFKFTSMALHLEPLVSFSLPRNFNLQAVNREAINRELMVAPMFLNVDTSKAQPSEVFDRFTVQQDVPLHPCGGSLLIEDWPAPPGRPAMDVRGCEDLPPEDGDPLRDPPGLSFRPMAEVPKAPPIPGVYSVRVGDALHPVEELHLDLGEKRDSDLSVRFALGVRESAADPFIPWLQINGICGLALPHIPDPNAPQPPTSMHVNGTIERGPIKPDLSDPVFTNLMAMAWLAGLQKGVHESTLFDVTFTLPASTVDSSDAFAYDINVKSSSAGTAEGFIETLTIPNSNPRNFAAPIKPARFIPGNSTPTLAAHLTHPPQLLPAGKIGINVVVYGKTAGAWWWKSHKEDFTIVEAPSLNKAGIPDSVPPNTPFDAVVAIRNNDDNVSFTIQTVTIDTEVNAKTNRNCPPHHIESYARHYPNGIAAELEIQVDAALEWQDGTANPISDSKIVKIHDDLTTTVDNVTPPTTAVALEFDLTIDNVGDRPLTNLSVKQRLTSPDFGAPMAWKPIVLPDFELDPGDQLPIPGVTGAKLPAASNQVTLQLDIEYERDGRTWHPPFVTKEVV